MGAKAILNANDVDELKRLGALTEIKSTLRYELGLHLSVKSWPDLLQSVNDLKLLPTDKKGLLLSICDSHSFSAAKAGISEIIGLKITSKGRRELKEKVTRLLEILPASSFDPYERFEETKLRNFKSSSKLEGIDIETPDESITLESILDEYRKQG